MSKFTALRNILILCFLLWSHTSFAASDKPNILVIWEDDVGQSNISAYTKGVVGYQTPNIDRIAKEGMIFTDYYGEQSCTAGRSSLAECPLLAGSCRSKPLGERLLWMISPSLVP
jgi:hypothetical protein